MNKLTLKEVDELWTEWNSIYMCEDEAEFARRHLPRLFGFIIETLKSDDNENKQAQFTHLSSLKALTNMAKTLPTEDNYVRNRKINVLVTCIESLVEIIEDMERRL